MPSIEFRKLLEALSQAGAEFIVVGGCAAVLQNVPISTFDLDIVHRRTPENIDRLLSVLATLDAHFYPDFARRNRLTYVQCVLYLFFMAMLNHPLGSKPLTEIDLELLTQADDLELLSTQTPEFDLELLSAQTPEFDLELLSAQTPEFDSILRLDI